MGIFSIGRDWGFTPSIVRISTTDTLATITTAGYLATQTEEIQAINGGAFEWAPTDFVLMFYSDNGGAWGFFTHDFSTGTLTPQPSNVPTPLLDGQLIIGSTGNPPAINTLTAGTNVTITNGPGTIQIDATGGGGGVTADEVQQSAFNFGVDTGTSTDYQVTLTPAPSAYTDGMIVAFKPANTNTDISCTLNVNGLGAQGIIINAPTAFLSLGDISNNYTAHFMYSATTQQFILLNPNVSVPVLRDMLTGNGYWSGPDQGVAADTYGLNLTANTASGANQFNPLFAILQFPNATNTGPSTLTFANAGPFAILDSKGNALVGGEIVQFKTAFMVFDGASSYLLMNSAL